MGGVALRHLDAAHRIVSGKDGGVIGAEPVFQRADEGRGVNIARAVAALGDLPVLVIARLASFAHDDAGVLRVKSNARQYDGLCAAGR